MNRDLTELAELRLHQQTAWHQIHVEWFSEIFAPGPGQSLRGVLGLYAAWCAHRRIWASFAELRRQLARAGYRVQGNTILGVQANVQNLPTRDRLDGIGVREASNFLGIEAGLLRSLREFGGGPPFGFGGKGITYSRAGLEAWREELAAGRATATPELWQCLESLCRFRAIEDRHFFRVHEIEKRACWARIENAVGRDKFAIRNNPAWLSHEREWDQQRYEHDRRTGSLRLVEADLLAAVTEWYMNESGAAPAGLRVILRKALQVPPLLCKLVKPKARPDGKRHYEWRGVSLRSAETSALTLAFENVREKSGLQITVQSLTCDALCDAQKQSPVIIV
jgi:hypothetical protein